MNRPNLAHGPHTLAIPGPSMMPPEVLAAFSRQMPDIYEGELIVASDALWELLPQIAQTTTAQQFVTIGNGHAAWEMALANTLAPGDRVLVANAGVFAAGWGEMAARMGCLVERFDAVPGRAVDPQQVYSALAADTSHSIRAVLTTQVDTASSARNDVPALRAAIDAAGHPALLMIDAVASFGCEELRMDAWGIDIMVAASQKGLMTPPGVGLVWAGPKAVEAQRHVAARGGGRSWYWAWDVRNDPSAHYLRYAGTPPVAHIFGLREAATQILAEGIENVWARHAALAGAVRAAVDAWSLPDGLALNCTEPTERSNAVTTIATGAIDADGLRALCQSEFGVTLGIGLRAFAGRSFRIGHMGYVSAASILGVLGVVEAALGRLGAPIGASGVAAAAGSLA